MKAKTKRADVPKLVFALAVFCFVFLLGGLFGARHWQPWAILADGFHAATEMFHQEQETRPWILVPKKYQGEGVTKYDRSKAFDGYTVMQGWFSQGTEVRLVDMEGKILHRWPADFFKVWDNPGHVIPQTDIPANRFHYHILGLWMLPDSSVVLNFANLGSVKLDKCGKVLWTIDRMTHHSITPNPDGTFWIPANGDIRKVPSRLMFEGVTREGLMHSEGAYEDRLLLVGADGTIKKEISVLKAMVDSGLDNLLYEMKSHYRYDPTHVNDIEVVTPRLAEKIPGVNTGDLLISMRQTSTLAILDKDTGKLKWHHSGPWVRQHDPDITPDGNIIVLNNEPNIFNKDSDARKWDHSSLVMLDPATNEITELYAGDDEADFFTPIQGTHQLLPNGNRLILESKGGRVFELDKSGKIVWQYVSSYDDEYASMIENAIRFDKNYFTVSDWSCN